MPDFLKVPHLRHVIILTLTGVLADVVVGVLAMITRVTSAVAPDVHTVRDIDPDEPTNMRGFVCL